MTPEGNFAARIHLDFFENAATCGDVVPLAPFLHLMGPAPNGERVGEAGVRGGNKLRASGRPSPRPSPREGRGEGESLTSLYPSGPSREWEHGRRSRGEGRLRKRV